MKATTAVVRTEARLFGRELGSVFWILLFPTLVLAILGAVPSSREPDEALGGVRLVDVYTSVSVLLAMIVASVISMPAVVASYRERGILRRLRTTPVHPGSLLGAQVGVHAAAVLAAIALALGTARMLYDVPLPEAPGWYIVSLLLATAASFTIGAVVTSVASTTRAAQTVGMVVFFPLMFTAGVYSPVPAMSGWLHAVVTLTPLGAGAEALNDALLGRSPDLADLAVIGAWTAVLALVAVRAFRWE
jgi:ABC-2 type transport system permease protein